MLEEIMKKPKMYVAAIAVAASLVGCGASQYEVMQKQQEEQRKVYQTERIRSHANEDHKDLDKQFE